MPEGITGSWPGAKSSSCSVAAFSRGIAARPGLAEFLGARRVVYRPGANEAGAIDCVVGWGYKKNTVVARRYAQQHGLPYVCIEDGFLRSIGPGTRGDTPLSVVLDDLGIYYDAGRASRLEAMLNEPDPDRDRLADRALLQRAGQCIDRIVGSRLSKYNDTPVNSCALPDSGGRSRVLVVDQTAGDLSIRYGLPHPGGFKAMLRAALEENPGAEILVKVHPRVIAGKKRGHLLDAGGSPRVRLMVEPVNPYALLEGVDRVYVVSSQMGFEALMAGKPVTCFGVPFYAGWGLTDDRVPLPRRERRRSLQEVFAAAYILYARYLDPDTGQSCEIERVMEYLQTQRDFFRRNQGAFFCFGFSFWKRGFVRSFLKSPGNRIVFARGVADAGKNGFDPEARLIVWGRRDDSGVRQLAARHRVPIWRMEDGFLRSVGLGSDLTAPFSLVVDTRGIYYDPSRSSDLEHILQQTDFSPAQLLRAAALRETIVSTGVSKYNLAGRALPRLPEGNGKKVVLVPGQVEDDASVELGCRDIRSNEALLKEVRAIRPDAYLIFKPHPDVVSGNRKGKVRLSRARALCDLVVDDASIAECLKVADEVHTMTSLVGFEALMRGIPVFVYGQPFYCGWGLTHDRHVVERRRRKLSLDKLVAGTLLIYPRYLDPGTGAFTTPECVVSRLLEERAARAGKSSSSPSWPVHQLQKLNHAWKGMADVR